MRIQVISDHHYEFHESDPHNFTAAIPYDSSVDVLVVAGDLTVWRGDRYADHAVAVMCDKCKWVVYVPGNHDYYNKGTQAHVEAGLAKLQMRHPNFKVLHSGEVWTHQNRRFLGDTMWYVNQPAVFMYRNTIADFGQMGEKLDWIFARNEDFRSFLHRELQAGDIVVTHHLPSDQSTPREFRGSTTQPYFVCNMEDIIKQREPAAWIHGHTHRRADYQLFSTRVLCNPVGYPGENGSRLRFIEPSVFEV